MTARKTSRRRSSRRIRGSIWSRVFGVLALAAREARQARRGAKAEPLAKAMKRQSRTGGRKLPGTVSTTGGLSSLKGGGGKGGAGGGGPREGRTVEDAWRASGRNPDRYGPDLDADLLPDADAESHGHDDDAGDIDPASAAGGAV